LIQESRTINRGIDFFVLSVFSVSIYYALTVYRGTDGRHNDVNTTLPITYYEAFPKKSAKTQKEVENNVSILVGVEVFDKDLFSQNFCYSKEFLASSGFGLFQNFSFLHFCSYPDELKHD
jgi:hypothetical protein